MLGLYIDTLIIGRIFCNMLSLLNKLTLRKELQIRTKIKITTTTKQKTHTNPCQSRESNPGPIAPQSNA